MATVTVPQCVVMADPAALLRRCGDRPLLAWQLREFSRFGVERALVLAADPAPLHAALPGIIARLPRPMAIEVVPDPAAGGFRALLDDRFLLWDGSALFTGNLARLLVAGPPARDGSVVLAGRGPLPNPVSLPAGPVPPPPRRRALILDRDGVLNVDYGYVGSRERFAWMPGALAAVRLATERGWHVFVATNQSGVARGLYGESAVIELHAWMADEARRAGGTIDDVRYCPFHPEAVLPQYRHASGWRKPAPGMILDLMHAWELRPEECLLVGDSPRDVEAAAAAGIAGHRFPGGDLAAFVAPLLNRPAG